MSLQGGEIIAQMLQKEGVKFVFGIIDGTYFGLYSKLEKYGIKLITPRHETCAVHMAAAYARVSGKIGVCIASNGPGVANALPGVAVENTEGNRVLLITSCRRNPIVYPDRGGSFQCFDQCAVIRPMAKYSEAVSIPERIPEILQQAFRRSYSGRPGVVHIDVPENYMNGKFAFAKNAVIPPKNYRRTSPIAPDNAQVEAAAKLLIGAEFPIIHAGSGIVHAQAFDELKQIAELLHAPVTSSWGARGALNEDSDLAVPMVYIPLNSKIKTKADVVLCLGSRIGETDWWGKAPYWADASQQKMIQVDIDDDFLGRNKPVDLAIYADVKVFLQRLITKLEGTQSKMNLDSRRKQVAKFVAEKDKSRKKLDASLDEVGTPMITSRMVNICDQIFDKDAIVVLDGGNTAVWGNFYHKCSVPNTMLSTPKMGMLGAGVSQALGAAVAAPERQVYCLIGDGAMGFHSQEVETAIRNNLKIIYLVVCDKQWGMVKMNQQFALRPLKTLIKKSLDEQETINADLGEIEFDKLAESMGAYGERVADADKLGDAIRRCIAQDKCAVIHVDVDPVKHMWAPSLMHFKKMHEEPKGK